MPPVTTTSALHVRRARLADLPFLQQDGNIPSHEFRRKIELGEIFVAGHGVEPIGSLRVDFFQRTIPLIASVFVLEGFRGRAVGKALVQHAEAVMRERGYRWVYSCMPSDEAGKLAWLRRLGFDECGFLSSPPGEPAMLFLRRQL